MIHALFVAASSAVIFMALVYIVLCTTYIMDRCVRLITNDRYAVITKLK